MNVKICMILATITGILILVNIYKNKVREGFYNKNYTPYVWPGKGGEDKKDNLCVGMDKDKNVYCVTANPNGCPWNNAGKRKEIYDNCKDGLFNLSLFNFGLNNPVWEKVKLKKSIRWNVVDACRTKNSRWDRTICSVKNVDTNPFYNTPPDKVSGMKAKGFHLLDLTNEPDQSYDKLKKIVEERGYVLPTADDLERFIALEDTNGITGNTERGYPITWSKKRDGVAHPTFSGKDVWMPTYDGDWIQGGSKNHSPGTSHIKDLKSTPIWHNKEDKSGHIKGYILAFDKNSDEIKRAKKAAAEKAAAEKRAADARKAAAAAAQAKAAAAAAAAKAEADRKAAAAAAAKAEADRKAAAEAEKKQIESYQEEIKRLSSIIEKNVEEANNQKSILESTQDKATQQQITDVIKPDITNDTEGIINNNNSIQKILNNFNNSKEETLKNLEKSKELSNESKEKIEKIQTDVKSYKARVEQKILTRNRLQKERDELIKKREELKSKLDTLDTTKSQLQTEISNLKSNGLNSQSRIKSINKKMLDTKNENSKIDSNIQKYKIQKYEGVVKKNSDYIKDTSLLIITDNNNKQNDDKNNQGEHIDGFTTITNILSNKPYQRNILSKNNITDEYD